MCIRDRWYNSRFRTALLGGEDRLSGRAQKLLPGLDTAQARTPEGQQLNLADGVWNVHSSTVPGGSESMTPVSYTHLDVYKRQGLSSTAPSTLCSACIL